MVNGGLAQKNIISPSSLQKPNTPFGHLRYPTPNPAIESRGGCQQGAEPTLVATDRCFPLGFHWRVLAHLRNILQNHGVPLVDHHFTPLSIDQGRARLWGNTRRVDLRRVQSGSSLLLSWVASREQSSSTGIGEYASQELVGAVTSRVRPTRKSKACAEPPCIHPVTLFSAP